LDPLEGEEGAPSGDATRQHARDTDPVCAGERHEPRGFGLQPGAAALRRDFHEERLAAAWPAVAAMNAAAGDTALRLGRAVATELRSDLARDCLEATALNAVLIQTLRLRVECSDCDRRGAGYLLLREPLPLAAQQRPEAEAIVQCPQRRKIRCLRPQVGGRDAEWHVADDSCQSPRQQNRFTVRGEPRADGAAAAQPEGGDTADIGVELIERAELAHQCGRDFRPYAWHAGNVVGRVADQGEEVGKPLGGHAEVALDVAVADLRAGAKVPQQVAIAYELREVFVARDEG